MEITRNTSYLSKCFSGVWKLCARVLLHLCVFHNETLALFRTSESQVCYILNVHVIIFPLAKTETCSLHSQERDWVQVPWQKKSRKDWQTLGQMTDKPETSWPRGTTSWDSAVFNQYMALLPQPKTQHTSRTGGGTEIERDETSNDGQRKRDCCQGNKSERACQG